MGHGRLMLQRVHVDPARATGMTAGAAARPLPFLSRGPVDIRLQSPLTFLVGENGSGKTTLLEAIAARCAIRPGGGASYAETDERESTALSPCVAVAFAGPRPRGLFLRADRFAEAMAAAGRLPMPPVGGGERGEWRHAEAQSRGEGVLSLLTARVDASEGMLFILDEPETGLSPRRQMALRDLLDALCRDGRSQALVATHAPILMSLPGADRLWIDQAGITRQPLEAIEHWRDMRHFMATADAAPAPPQDVPRPALRLWILSDLHLEAVPYPQAWRPQHPDFDVLVVAGDVWDDIPASLAAVARLAAGKPAVCVLGNAELGDGAWSGTALDDRRALAQQAAREHGIVLLDDREVALCGARFVGGTLWTDGRLGQGGAMAVPSAVPSAAELQRAALHRHTRGLIAAVAARPRDRLVVVTHHAPHPACLPAADRDRPDAGGFASDLSALTDSGRIALWVHGHVHDTVDLTRPGGTRIVCNAAGQGFRNPAFRDDWVIAL